ncbi:MAG: peptide chain release factor aRF-1 [Candidatus Nanoarchaeia archaeon]|nr:peptide chain release factor aRF-1 [Candidatus Nanoarchaeia archaeon]
MSTLTTLEKHKLKKFIRSLELIRGRHTELVSVYIPAGYDLNKIINHISQEQGTASNIKDKTTRTHVTDSLERMIRHLRLFKNTPPNGLAVFSGDASEREGKPDIQVWSIEPPQPINTRLYRCEQTFQLDILKEMMEVKEVFGIVTLDRRECTIGLLKGTQIAVLDNITSGVPGKVKAGGQSAQRYSRLREEASKEFFKRIASLMQDHYLELKNLKGIIVGGPGPSKLDYLNEPYLNNQLKLKIIAVQDISYTDEFGLRELVEKSQDVLAKEAITEEKEVMQKLLKQLAVKPEMIAYGKDEVLNAIALNAVDKVLISDFVEDTIANDIEEKAEASGAKVMFISLDTPEGVQLKEIGGIAAFLRYQLA